MHSEQSVRQNVPMRAILPSIKWFSKMELFRDLCLVWLALAASEKEGCSVFITRERPAIRLPVFGLGQGPFEL